MKVFWVVFAFLAALVSAIAPVEAQVTAADLRWDFESGSLGSVQAVSPNDLNLTLRLDDAYGDLYGWYNFKIIQHAAGQQVTFHILNPDNWFTAEHKPVYSQDGGQTWQRLSDTWMASGDFHFRQTFTADSAWIALAFPYTYTRLLTDLDSLSASPYFTNTSIGSSVHGRPIPLATLTDPLIPNAQKRTVWLMSRQHPMETPASYVLLGLLQLLTDPANPEADRMRRTTIFKILPMVNVDGVAEGFSRHNVNGINLNRCWAYDSLYTGEQPEVNACHRAMDDWINSGHRIDLFNDFHCCPDLHDFGYRLSQNYTYPAYNQDAVCFTQDLDDIDPWQNWTLWLDMESSYGYGLVCMSLYNQHNVMALSSENSWSRRGNGQYITIPTLTLEGGQWAYALDHYLHKVRITEAQGNIIEQLVTGDSLRLQVRDYDEAHYAGIADTVLVAVYTEGAGDVESFVLIETGANTAIFANPTPFAIQTEAALHGDGIVQVNGLDQILAVYVDHNFAPDSSGAGATWQNTSPVVRLRPERNGDGMLMLAPNPANGVSSLSFTLKTASPVRLEIFDMLGRMVQKQSWPWLAPGQHTHTWVTASMTSGIYNIKVTAGEEVQVVRGGVVK
jgi:hypothetical protein